MLTAVDAKFHGSDTMIISICILILLSAVLILYNVVETEAVVVVDEYMNNVL